MSASSRSSARAGSTAPRRTASRSSTTTTATSTSTTWRPARRRTSPWACRPSFINTEDDHNVVNPPTQPMGWIEGQQGGPDHRQLGHLAGAGRRRQPREPDGQRPEGRRSATAAALPLEPRGARGRHRPVASRSTSRVYGEWTKKGGIAPSRPRQARAHATCSGTMRRIGGVMKAEKADVVLYTKETAIETADYYVTDATFGDGEAADRHAAAGGAVPLDAGRPARELHLRQGRQAAGGAVPAGQLREGQAVSDARVLLREDVADGATRSARRAPTASTGRSTPATATRC